MSTTTAKKSFPTTKGITGIKKDKRGKPRALIIVNLSDKERFKHLAKEFGFSMSATFYVLLELGERELERYKEGRPMSKSLSTIILGANYPMKGKGETYNLRTRNLPNHVDVETYLGDRIYVVKIFTIKDGELTVTESRIPEVLYDEKMMQYFPDEETVVNHPKYIEMYAS